MMNAAEVASGVAATIAPFTPYLMEIAKEGGKKLTEVIAEKGGEAAWNKAQTLWEQVKSHFGDDPEVDMAAKMMAFDPADEDRQVQFAAILAKRLETDRKILEEFAGLFGSQERIQEMIADNNSLMLKVSQKIGKGSGTQTMEATDGSIIIGGKQSMD